MDSPVESQADSFPVENPFGVPATLATARLRLPSGASTLALSSATGLSESAAVPSATVPSEAALAGIAWVSADTVLWRWDVDLLAELASVLAATGTRLAFVEPTAGLGYRHRLQVAAGPWLARRRRHRHHRDVPAELRAVGLTVTTTVRFRDGVGHYVWGEARHYTHPITTR